MAGDGGPHRHNCRGEINYLHTAPSSAAGASQDSDMDITPSLKRSRESSIQSNHQGPLTHCVVQKNIKDIAQKSKRKNQPGMAKPSYDQIESDQSCSSTSGDRTRTISGRSNNGQKKKREHETFDRQTAYFPSKGIICSKYWCLYRIIIGNDRALGFIVPCKLLKLSKFFLYSNGEQLESQVIFLREVNFQECKTQLQQFTIYIFEKVFCHMNSGLGLNLKFDLDRSTFKLLPCFLTDSDEFDYSRMGSIYDRGKRPVDILSETSNQEIYIRTNINKESYFKMTNTRLSQGTSRKPKQYGKVEVERYEKPSLNYLIKSESSSNKRQKTDASPIQNCQIKHLRHDALNQIDLELSFKLPSALIRIAQLRHVEELFNILVPIISPNSVLDIGSVPPVTFCDALNEMISSRQGSLLPLESLNEKLEPILDNNFQLLHDLLFQAICTCSAEENTNMNVLATLGDSFLDFAVALPIYSQYLSGQIENPAKQKEDQVANNHLRRLALEKGLKGFLNSIKIILSGSAANWLLPGYVIDDEHSQKFLTQVTDQKAFGDMIEAIIGVLLVSTGYAATIRFMAWLGLDVSWTEQSVRWIQEMCHAHEKSNAIVDIERKLQYQFENKNYLMAVFMPYPSYEFTEGVNYQKLKFIGNPLLKFLITRYILLNGKLTTSGDISTMRDKLITNEVKAKIMVANDLNNIIMCDKVDKMITIPIDDNHSSDRTITYYLFDALIGAIFIDSNFSLERVWNVLKSLMEKHINLDSEIENYARPSLNQ